MRNREIEDRLRRAVAQSVPDVLEGILSGCEQKGKVIPMQTRNRKVNRWIAIASAAAAVLVLMVGGLYGWRQYSLYYAVDSIIGLDVNPGIELKVSETERILETRAINDDAVGILDNMELKGTTLDVAVNAIIGSMLKNGYLGDLSNSILVTVENQDEARGQELQQRLVNEIQGILSSNALEGSILSQTLQEDAELQALSETYGISMGKASLIQSILRQDTLHTVEDLVGLTIHELNLLSSSNGVQLSGITASGVPSDDAYIGEDRALQAALTHAGLTSEQIQLRKIKLDWDDGRAEYEVEFIAGTTKYDYDIDAFSGQVISFDHEAQHVQATPYATPAPTSTAAASQTAAPQTASPTPMTAATKAPAATQAPAASNLIGEEKAKEIALAHAGVAANSATFTKVKLDWDDGRQKYDIAFYSGMYEYELEIDAQTGAVREYDWDAIDDDDRHHVQSTPKPTATPAANSQDIGRDRAQQIALGHAGVSASQVTGLKVERDRDDGRQVYDVEFDVGRTEYSYEIDAASGNILQWEKDVDD